MQTVPISQFNKLLHNKLNGNILAISVQQFSSHRLNIHLEFITENFKRYFTCYFSALKTKLFWEYHLATEC